MGSQRIGHDGTTSLSLPYSRKRPAGRVSERLCKVCTGSEKTFKDTLTHI